MLLATRKEIEEGRKEGRTEGWMEQKTCMQEGTSSYVGNALLYLRQTTLPLRNTPNQTNALNIELCICQ